MTRVIPTLLIAAARLLAQTSADCQNQVAKTHPMDRTIGADVAVLIVEVPREKAQQAVDQSFLALNLNKPTLLPLPDSLNVSKGMHPVIVTSAVDNDIRQSVLKIDGKLRQNSIIVPYCGIGSSSTPFGAPLVTFIAGTKPPFQDILAGIVPAVAATAFGIFTRLGMFIPPDVPYQTDGTELDKSGLYSSTAAAVVVPNPISGPGIYPDAVDILFSNATKPKYSMAEMKQMINQPYILNAPFNILPLTSFQCQRNTYFTNYDTAEIRKISGKVTFGTASDVFGKPGASPLQEGSPEAGGVYPEASGFTACAQLIGYGGFGTEECEKAAENVDSASLS